MRQLIPISALIWALLPLGAASAQEVEAPTDRAAQTEADIQAKVTKALEAYEAAEQAWINKMRAATAEERDGLRSERPNAGEALKTMISTLEGHEGSAPHWRVVQWCFRSMGPDATRMHFEAQLLKEYRDKDELASMVWRMSGDTARPFLDKIIAQTKNVSVRGMAEFGVVSLLQRDMGAADIDAATAARIEAEITKRLTALDKPEFAELPLYGNVTLGAKAKATLFEIQNLSIGKTAPDIRAEDVDGTPFALSDYRGKVVMLDFWGDW